MSDAIRLEEIVLDESIYPRSERNTATVRRYVEAMAEGDVFPPIVLETGTRRLLDGWHRYAAAHMAGIEELAADWHTVPVGVDAKLYAASLSVKNGIPIAESDQRQLARDLYAADPDVNVTEIARSLRRNRRTVNDWVSDLAEAREAEQERARAARRLAVALLRESGWKQADIAEALGVSQQMVSKINTTDGESANGSSELDEALIRAALDLVPEDARRSVSTVAERWREERIFATWSDEERDLLDRLRDDEETVVLNMRTGTHDNLVKWANDAGLFVRIDRKTAWGNPFELPDDGDRETVIANYANHYLPHKPSLLSKLDDLVGRALGCWCAPEACHGDILKGRAEE